MFERYLAADWPRLRQGGRRAYIWYNHILLFGFPMVLVFTVWIAKKLHWGIGELLTAQFWIVVSLECAVPIAYGYIKGGGLWDYHESRYRQEHGLPPESRSRWRM